MDGIDLKLRLVVPKLDGLDSGAMMSALRKASTEIERIVEPRIRARAKASFTKGYSTGAFAEDVTGKSYTGEVTGKRQATLASWYVGSDNQLAEWGRVYAPYQEGPPLGKTTYTTGMHQIFQRIETEDQPVIQAWADAVIADWVERATAEANANATEEEE